MRQKVKPGRYTDYLSELASGQRPAIFVDDSGSPGANVGMDADRKTWVAVVLTAGQAAEAMQELPPVLEELRRHLGGDELHFTDIYSGRGAFKDKPLDLRLGLFRFMAEIFTTHAFPIFVQTFTPAEV